MDELVSEVLSELEGTSDSIPRRQLIRNLEKYVRLVQVDPEDSLYRAYNLERLVGNVGLLVGILQENPVDASVTINVYDVEEGLTWWFYKKDCIPATKEEYETQRILREITR